MPHVLVPASPEPVPFTLRIGDRTMWDTRVTIVGIGEVVGTSWFCPGCGEGVIITSQPVAGLLLNRDAWFHKHDGTAVLAGFLDEDALGSGRALKFAAKIDTARSG